MSDTVKLIIEIDPHIIYAIQNNKGLSLGQQIDICNAIKNGIPLDDIPSAENKGEWIPVTERLPETHQDVLLELRSGEMLTGFKAETEPYFYCHGADGCYVEPQNVLAWQPLPEPYKGGEV